MGDVESHRVGAGILEPEAHRVRVEPTAQAVGHRDLAALGEGQQGVLLSGVEGDEGTLAGGPRRSVEGPQGGAVGLPIRGEGDEAPAVSPAFGKPLVEPRGEIQARHRNDPGEDGPQDGEFHRVQGHGRIGGVGGRRPLGQGVAQP